MSYRKAFYFLLLIPIVFLVYEIRITLMDMREAQGELFLLNAQRASQQRTILGLQTRILHHVEEHEAHPQEVNPVDLVAPRMLHESGKTA